MLLTLRHKKNTALTLVFPLTDADGQPITGAANLDSECSYDGAAFNDCTNETAEIGVTGWYSLVLTAAEMDNGTVAARIQTSTAGIMPLAFALHTYTEPLDDANTELAAIPTTVSGLRAMVQFLFQKLRNRETFNKDTGVSTVYKEDATTALGTSTSSDNGTTVDRGEIS